MSTEPSTNAYRGAARHVVVVGAGIVGVNLALELAVRGVRVTILDEAGPLSAGATSKSFAWVTNQAFFRATDPVPADRARSYFNLHRLGHNAWRRLSATFGPRLGIQWHGTVQWTDNDGAEIERLTTELVRRQNWGSGSYSIDRAALLRLLPGSTPGDVNAAFYTPDEASVNPFAAVQTLLDAAVAAGARLRAPCRVVDFKEASNGQVTVVHEGGTLTCDQVVLAAGRQTSELASQVGIPIPLVESVGELVHLAPLERFLTPLVLGPDVHAVQRNDGRVVLAHHYTGAPVSDDVGLDPRALLNASAATFPQLEQATIERVTSGRRILPADGLPIVGRSTELPQVWAVATNAGISLGPVLGELLTIELLDGARVDLLEDYRADRFQPAAT